MNIPWTQTENLALAIYKVYKPVHLALNRTKLSELSAESAIKLKLTTSKHNEKKKQSETAAKMDKNHTEKTF